MALILLQYLILKKKEKLTDFYRFIRLRQTGHSWHNSYYVYLQSIEFFGQIKEMQAT